jgi:hypothetical protein
VVWASLPLVFRARCPFSHTPHLLHTGKCQNSELTTPPIRDPSGIYVTSARDADGSALAPEMETLAPHLAPHARPPQALDGRCLAGA